MDSRTQCFVDHMATRVLVDSNMDGVNVYIL